MNVKGMPELIDLFRETFEGDVGSGNWITDGAPGRTIFGVLASVPAERAFAAPAGAKSVAAHAEHLRFSLDLMFERMQGKDPEADWKSSFNIPPASAGAWTTIQSELRRAYDAVLGVLQQNRQKSLGEMPPLHVVGLSALTAHNAYHLGAILQLIRFA